MGVSSQYRGVAKILRAYWVAYGGATALLTSPYFHVSVLLTAAAFRTWTSENWWNDPISTLPNIIGFSIAGYAVIIAFGDEKFRKTLIGNKGLKDGQASPFIVVNATFVHAVLVQLLALIYALIAKGHPIASLLRYFPAIETKIASTLWLASIWTAFAKIGWFLGYLIFLYGLALTVAAAMGIFRLAGWYDMFRPDRDRDNS